MDHVIYCPVCKKPMRHRVISNLRYCANPECDNYKGIPPIKVNIKTDSPLRHAFSAAAWEEVDRQIKAEQENNNYIKDGK